MFKWTSLSRFWQIYTYILTKASALGNVISSWRKIHKIVTHTQWNAFTLTSATHWQRTATWICYRMLHIHRHIAICNTLTLTLRHHHTPWHWHSTLHLQIIHWHWHMMQHINIHIHTDICNAYWHRATFNTHTLTHSHNKDSIFFWNTFNLTQAKDMQRYLLMSKKGGLVGVLLREV